MSGHRKWSEIRPVPLTDEDREAIRELHRQHPEDRCDLFRTTTGKCTCKPAEPHCLDCGSTHLHEGPNDPPPYCCCMDCGSTNLSD